MTAPVRKDRLFIPRTPQPPRPAAGRMVWPFELPRGQAQVVAASGLREADVQALMIETIQTTAAALDRRSPGSELARFNAAPAGTWMLAEPLWSILNDALDLADDVNGAYDPTLGALNDLWASPEARLSPTAPDEEVLAALRSVSRWDRFRLHRPAQAAVQPGGTRLDFDEVADAVACDRVIAVLAQLGVEAATVRIGRNVAGHGLRWDGMPWWTEIWSGGEGAPRWVAALLDQGIGVSGFEGVRPVDGDTGRPVDNDLVGVIVLDRSCFRAQAMARALHVMGPTEGVEFAKAIELPALFIERTAQGPVERLSPVLTAMEETGQS